MTSLILQANMLSQFYSLLILCWARVMCVEVRSAFSDRKALDAGFDTKNGK